MKLKVRRELGDGSPVRYDHFEVNTRESMTVLDALFQVREVEDDSLSFRYSCRGAVCGSCAMLINRRPRLACRTLLSSLGPNENLPQLAPIPGISDTPFVPGEEVLIEPLPNLPVIKDLVVDMAPFFEKYRRLRPRLIAKTQQLERENIMSEAEVEELEKFTNCILCAACYGACPINSLDPEYLGPAALAKLYRFAIDPRDAMGKERLDLAPGGSGWQGCRFYTNCVKVCPKNVPPNFAIGKAKQELRSREGKA
jgi:succinate dehydrogenase / fumarate reductase iron-sulfur subunit